MEKAVAISPELTVNTKTKTRRIWELDFLRGICVLLMIWDHLMFDIAEVFADAWVATGKPFLFDLVEFASEYLVSDIRTLFHPIIFTMFFVICGISCTFSRNNLLRGIEALILAYLITVVTTIMGMTIRFGVLHMLGFAILTWWLINTLCMNKPKLTAFACLAIGIIIILINQYLTANPPPPNDELAFIGRFFETKQGIYDSADYFPILPYVGYMLIGAAFGPFLYKNRKSLLPWLDKYNWHAPIGFCGRIALIVYVTHQVLIMVILCLLSYLFFTPGDFVLI